MYAAVPGYAVGQAQGLVGELSSTTSVGATYSLSARVAVASSFHAGTFEMRLRNSATGAQSALIAHTSITYTGNWMQITGTVTANANYDRVVIRAYHEGGYDLVDDVQMCEAATQTRACTTSASNLVQNPSFEQVIGTGTPWWIYDITTTEVPHWAIYPNNSGSYVDQFGGWLADGPPTAFQGTRYLILDQNEGVVGELSAPTNMGTTYVLSARISRGPYAWLQPSTFELQLRNGATGDESAPVAQASSNFLATSNWVLLTGVITTNVNYDRVVVRYSSDSNVHGYVDDVQLCVATVSTNGWGWWLWTLGAFATFALDAGAPSQP